MSYYFCMKPGNTSEDFERFLNDVSVPRVNYKNVKNCGGVLNEFELLRTLKVDAKQ